MATADALTYPTASALRDCMRAEAVDTLLGRVADAVVRFGAAGGAVMDGCDCGGTDADGNPTNGRAAVRVAQVAPYVLAGRAERGGGGIRAQRCGQAWIVTYELTYVRCYPTTSDGRPLLAVDVDVQAQRFLSDQAALMRVINCCAYLDKHSGVELVTIVPVGPSGGCAGVQATIRVAQARG